MKRNNFIALTLFGVLLLCALVQLSAELTLQQAEQALGEKERALQNANTHLLPAHAEMLAKYVEWTQNEEEVNRDNLLAFSTARDPAAMVSLGIMQAADISDFLVLSRELAGKISTFNTKQKAVNDAAKELQTAWDTYIQLAQHLSPGERYVIDNTPARPSYPTASLTCPACNVTYSGENLGGIGDHITFCSVNGHKVSPYPYFSCESSGCRSPMSIILSSVVANVATYSVNRPTFRHHLNLKEQAVMLQSITITGINAKKMCRVYILATTLLSRAKLPPVLTIRTT